MHIFKRLPVLLLPLLAACSGPQALPCGADLHVVAAPTLHLPPESGRSTLQSAKVRIVVERDGTVSNARLLSETFREPGVAIPAPTDPNPAILAAAMQWRFRPVPFRCTLHITVGPKQQSYGA